MTQESKKFEGYVIRKWVKVGKKLEWVDAAGTLVFKSREDALSYINSSNLVFDRCKILKAVLYG